MKFNSETLTLWSNIRRHESYFRQVQLIAIEFADDDIEPAAYRVKSHILTTLSSTRLREGSTAASDIAYWMTVESLRRVEWNALVIRLLKEDELV